MHIYKWLNRAAMINGIWKHPLETIVKRKEGYCLQVFNTLSQNRYFLLSLKFSPPPFLTAEYNFLNTAIFCSGNGTGMIFFQLDFFPSSARNVSPFPAAPFTCILSDRLPRDWLYSLSKAKLIIGIFQLLSLELVHLRTLPLNTAYIKWSSIYPTGTCSRIYIQVTRSQEWEADWHPH